MTTNIENDIQLEMHINEQPMSLGLTINNDTLDTRSSLAPSENNADITNEIEESEFS